MSRANVPVIGIDPSFKGCGVVVLDANGNAFSKVFSYSLKKNVCKIERIRRLLYFSSSIVKFAMEHKVHRFAIEHAIFGSGFRSAEIRDLTTVLSSQVYLKFGVIPIPMAFATIKKYHTGDGKTSGSKKTDISHCLTERYGYKFESSDEYDAAAVARILFDNLNVDRDSFSTYQRSVHKKIDIEVKSFGDIKCTELIT